MRSLLWPLILVAAGMLKPLILVADGLPLTSFLRRPDMGSLILIAGGIIWAAVHYTAKPHAAGSANPLSHLSQHSQQWGQWGRWLLWIGVGSQLLPALHIAQPFRYLFGGKQATAGFLISVLGGFLCGFDKAKTQTRAAPPAERHADSSAARPRDGTASGPAQPSAASSSTPKQPASPLHGITHFNVVLVDAGPRKVDVIEEVHKLIGKRLTEAFDLVNAAPVCIKGDLPENEARAILIRLRGLGATVELR